MDESKTGDAPPGKTEPKTTDSLQKEDRVALWQRDLRRQIERLEPYLVTGRLVTFTGITEDERGFFEWLTAEVAVPPTARAVFIPPSVVQKAMWPGSGSQASEAPRSGNYGISPDAGAVVAVPSDSTATIVNALFAFPPLSPGIDVYEEDRLVGGYSYPDPAACAKGLAEVLAAYLR